MQTINIHKVKTHLSSLVDQVFENEEAFIIAKSGKPMVKAVPIDTPEPKSQNRVRSMIYDKLSVNFQRWCVV